MGDLPGRNNKDGREGGEAQGESQMRRHSELFLAFCTQQNSWAAGRWLARERADIPLCCRQSCLTSATQRPPQATLLSFSFKGDPTCVINGALIVQNGAEKNVRRNPFKAHSSAHRYLFFTLTLKGWGERNYFPKELSSLLSPDPGMPRTSPFRQRSWICFHPTQTQVLNILFHCVVC